MARMATSIIFVSKYMTINEPGQAVQAVLSLVSDPKKEHVITIYLNSRNDIICREVVSIGTLNMSLVHPREIFRPAIINHSASLIFLHNHPSGSLEFSDDDLQVVARLKNAGTILGIDVTDSIVFDEKGNYKSQSNN